MHIVFGVSLARPVAEVATLQEPACIVCIGRCQNAGLVFAAVPWWTGGPHLYRKPRHVHFWEACCNTCAHIRLFCQHWHEFDKDLLDCLMDWCAFAARVPCNVHRLHHSTPTKSLLLLLLLRMLLVLLLWMLLPMLLLLLLSRWTLKLIPPIKYAVWRHSHRWR